MPQIWMTYEEVADLLECGTEQAYARIRQDGLDRKISHDGRKRVKLDLALTGLFLDRVRAQVDPLDRAIMDMRNMHSLMIAADTQRDLFSEPEAGEVSTAA